MKRFVLLFTVVVLLAAHTGHAQEHSIREKLHGITSQVSTDRLRADIDALVGFHTRNTYSDTSSDTKGIGAARRWLYQEFQKINEQNGGGMKVYMDYFYQRSSSRSRSATSADSVKMANVIAVFPGTRSDRILHLNGHYDSITSPRNDLEAFAPGANDDASGVVALLELARILSKHTFYNTIMLAALTGEEYGLFGSTYTAAKAVEEGWNLEGVIANDMIANIHGGDGKSDNTFLRCFSQGPGESVSRNLALYFEAVSEKFVPDLDLKMIFRLDRFGRGGDHSPFVNQGFAGVRFTEPYENYDVQHSPQDTPDRMSFEYFTRTTKMNAALAAYWANSPAPPMIVSISRDDDYRTVLSFVCDEPPEYLSGFKVVIRETDSGYWDESQFFPVPERTESRRYGAIYRIVIPDRDQDYYIFGLASVNTDGYESIATTYDRARIQQRRQNR